MDVHGLGVLSESVFALTVLVCFQRGLSAVSTFRTVRLKRGELVTMLDRVLHSSHTAAADQGRSRIRAGDLQRPRKVREMGIGAGSESEMPVGSANSRERKYS